MDGWIDKWDQWIDGWFMDGQTGESMEGWMDGLMDGWISGISGLTDQWIHVQMYVESVDNES